MDLAIVVVHYRNWPDISDTLRSIEAQSRPDDFRVVVDSRSGDGSPELIAQAHPAWHVIQLERNAGYAAAVNRALSLKSVRRASRVLICTHEVILGGDAVDALLGALEAHVGVAAVGPVLSRRSDGSVWSSGGALGRRTSRPWHRQDIPGSGSEPRVVEWLDGAVVLYRADALRRVGPMDEDYFLYYEELDYQMRMRGAGWQLAIVPDATAAQEPGMVPPYLEARNRIRWLRRTRRWIPLIFALAEQVATVLKRLPVRAQWWEVSARLRGLLHGFTDDLDQDIALRRAETTRSNASSC